ncbi:MAG: hypothetical protein RJB39_733 [Candidatus Parcubacteria bacterium]|jgi:putative hydrolase of HD superfamily
MPKELEEILKLSYSFAAIDRDLYYPERPRPENDAEHAFQLSLAAWYIIELNKFPLDQSKVFKLCLAHDLVEVYSGDVPLWGKTGHDEKAAREHEALHTLEQKFPLTPDLTDVIAEYKERKTDEARFVYGLDKLLPFLNQLTTEGKVWKMREVSLAQTLEKTDTFKGVSTYLSPYFDEAIEYVKTHQERFFDVR